MPRVHDLDDIMTNDDGGSVISRDTAFRDVPAADSVINLQDMMASRR